VQGDALTLGDVTPKWVRDTSKRHDAFVCGAWSTHRHARIHMQVVVYRYIFYEQILKTLHMYAYMHVCVCVCHCVCVCECAGVCVCVCERERERERESARATEREKE